MADKYIPYTDDELVNDLLDRLNTASQKYAESQNIKNSHADYFSAQYNLTQNRYVLYSEDKGFSPGFIVEEYNGYDAFTRSLKQRAKNYVSWTPVKPTKTELGNPILGKKKEDLIILYKYFKSDDYNSNAYVRSLIEMIFEIKKWDKKLLNG